VNKTKLWFGLLILLLISIWAITPFWFGRIDFIKVNPMIYNYTEHHSCHITITEPTVILRMDDVRVYSTPVESLIDEVLDNNISIVLGVIPRDLEQDKQIVSYLNKIKKDPRVEIAQHGDNHDRSDFFISEENLIKGNTKIQELIGVVPISYIPPFNEIDQKSLGYIEQHFKVISMKNGVIKEGRIAEISETIGSFYYGNNSDVSNGKVFLDCADSLSKYNLCVVTIHPQEWGLTKLENFEDFRDLLFKLKQLNTTFSTFNKVVYCEE